MDLYFKFQVTSFIVIYRLQQNIITCNEIHGLGAPSDLFQLNPFNK